MGEYLVVDVVATPPHFALRAVHRQVAHAVALPSAGSQHDALALTLVADDHAEVRLEKLRCVEVAGHLEALLRDVDVHYAVQREHHLEAVFPDTEQIPPVASVFESVGRHAVVLRLGMSVASVVYLYDASPFHRLGEGAQCVVFVRLHLGQYAVVQREVFADEAAHADEVHHPALQCWGAQVFAVLDVVSVAVGGVAQDVDGEHVLYGLLVSLECGAHHRQPAAHLGFLPPFVEFFEADAACVVDGFDDPDVLFELFCDSHCIFLL